jgi:cobalt-precorrin 5A hydrolase
LTPRGCKLARNLARGLGAGLFVPEKYRENQDETAFSKFGQMLATRFQAFSGHVFIAAAGIVVRCIAPLLRSKVHDPAVVVLDQNGRFAISLVGGHAAGANALAAQVAGMTGGQAVITTATDTAGLPALDVLIKDLHLVPDSPGGLKNIAASLLAGRMIQLWDPEQRLWPTLVALGHEDVFLPVRRRADWHDSLPGVWVSWRSEPRLQERLLLHPRCLVAGIGVHRGVPARDLLAFITSVLHDNGLALASLRTLATISSRTDEPGLQELSSALNVDVMSFTREELAKVPTPHPSSTTARLMGTHSVCEAATILASGNQALLVPKTKARAMTLAVALAV